MERSGGHPTPGTAPDAPAGGEPAIRDAADILARIAADEAAADEARERYRVGPMGTIVPDARVAGLLEPGEFVVATRASVVLERREPQPKAGSAGVGGELYVTSRRLLLLGRARLSIGLEDIEEVVLSGERLLVVLRDGKGLSIDASLPRLLRVEIATARSAARD